MTRFTSDFLNYCVGFETIFNSLENLTQNERPYPHYDVQRIDEDTYVIEMALAGYKKENIKVMVKDNFLIVEGKSDLKKDNSDYVRRGIAQRSFKKRLQISDHLECKDAKFEDGMLSVHLKNIREKNTKQITVK